MRNVRGAFIVLVGPDGVGKTSVAAELVRLTGGVYCHFQPPLWRKWDSPVTGQLRNPATRARSSKAGSIVRITRNLIRFWIGYLTSVRPALSAGTTVIADRWAYGYIAKPYDLRYTASSRVSRVVIRWFPRPDLIAALVAPAEVIVDRKPELDVESAARDLVAWSSLPVAGVFQFDATPLPPVIAADILRVVTTSA